MKQKLAYLQRKKKKNMVNKINDKMKKNWRRIEPKKTFTMGYHLIKSYKKIVTAAWATQTKFMRRIIVLNSIQFNKCNTFIIANPLN